MIYTLQGVRFIGVWVESLTSTRYKVNFECKPYLTS